MYEVPSSAPATVPEDLLVGRWAYPCPRTEAQATEATETANVKVLKKTMALGFGFSTDVQANETVDNVLKLLMKGQYWGKPFYRMD